MYSSSPIPSYAICDRRPTLGTMDSPQQQQQTWAPIPMSKQQQDMNMTYMVHHGYHVTPTSSDSSSSQYHQHNPFATKSPSIKQQMNRAVIPSKRAAQNRAAQKAFRQRRDQYVKDLEKKSKEMELWKQELDTIKDENRQLKSLVHRLEQRISSLTCQQVPENCVSSVATTTSSASSSSSITVSSPIIPSPRSPSLPTLSTSSISHPSSSPSPNISSFTHADSTMPSSSQQQPPGHSFLLPVSLRPHSFLPSKDDSLPLAIPSSTTSSSSFVVAAPAGQVAASTQSSTFPTGHPPLFELDLDPFFDDDFGFPRIDDQLDFVGHTNGGQVLDDLFTMLQTRQRPQIPLQAQPHIQRQQQRQQQSDQSSSHYSMVDRLMPNQHSSSS